MEILSFDFMRHAFLGCFLVSLLAGATGWFMLLRRQAFAAHALPHIGFSGAAAALWFGVSPFLGMILASMVASLAMVQGERERHEAPFWQRETMTGLVLAASLGFGVWCLHEAPGASNQTAILLFGDVLGLSWHDIMALAVVFIICAVGLVILWRVLVFSSLSPILAQGRGVPVKGVSLAFMMIVALVASACSEVAGALLSFSLMIGPGASALRLNLSPLKGISFSVISALFLSWGGLILSWYSDIPVAFWIGVGALLLYLGTDRAEYFWRQFKNKI